MKKVILIFAAVLTIPLLLALLTWQSCRYLNLKNEISRLDQSQADWVESNKRMIAGIAVLSSPRRIENIARNELYMQKIKPENVLQVKITGGKGREL